MARVILSVPVIPSSGYPDAVLVLCCGVVPVDDSLPIGWPKSIFFNAK